MDTDPLAPGSHVQHAQGTANISCATCHNGYTETTAAVATHTSDQLVNLGFTGNAVGTVYSQGTSHALGTGYGTCSTSNCHGAAASPTWGSNTANATCTKCHGTPSASATNANMAPTVGAHQAHVHGATSYSYSKELSCTECHNSDKTTITFTNHMNGNTQNVVFTNASTAAKNGVTPTWTVGAYPNGTCSTYCHGTSLKNGDTSGLNRTPSWTANLMTGVLANDCAQCHGNPPASVPVSHTGATATTSCTACHSHFNASGGFDNETNRKLHIDGIVQATGGTCDGCHDYDTVGATYTANKWDGGTWGKAGTDYGRYLVASGGTSLVAEGWGAHATHINHIKTRLGINVALTAAGTFGSGQAASVCGTCHTNTGTHNMSGSTTDPTGRKITFGGSDTVGSGTYLLGSFNMTFGGSAPLYNGVSGTPSSTTNKTCLLYTSDAADE